jgi:hypothetical protein
LKRLLSIVLHATLLFFVSREALPQSANLPIGHWAYDFLDRLETKGLVRDIALRTRPISRARLAKIIARIDSRVNTEPQLLSKTDQRLFEQLKGEFSDEMTDLGISYQRSLREPHLVTMREDSSSVYFDALFEQRVILRSSRGEEPADRRLETTGGGIIRGRLHRFLAFELEARNTAISGAEDIVERFDPSLGRPQVTTGNLLFSDQARAYAVASNRWVRLQVGRDRAHWGPGRRGSMTVSSQMPEAEMFRLWADFRNFRFTYMHAFLRSSLGPKYLAAHRLDVRLGRRLFLSGTESVIYGGRDVEFQYLNPLMPYQIAEHHLGDRDNNMLSFDLVYFPVDGLKTYAELLIDDLSFDRNLINHWGNKYAILLGLLWTDAFRIANLDLGIEVARVDPFVYTHRDSINTYQHYDQSIGHWLGPNADDVLLALRYQPTRDTSLRLELTQTRRGKGDINTPHRPEDGPRKGFLSGTVEKRRGVSVSLTDQLLRDLFVTLRFGWARITNLQRQPGMNITERNALLLLQMNY